MFRSNRNQHSFFRISSADWEYMCLADDSASASAYAIRKMIEKESGNLNLSFTIIVDKIEGTKIKREFFYAPIVLADAGFPKLAKDFSDIYDFFLDNGAERH